MTTFSQETRELALQASNGYCMCSIGCFKKATEFHHKLSNTKVNQSLYPLFLQSIFNCCPIERNCHAKGHIPRIREPEARAFEQYLTNLIKGEYEKDKIR